MYPLSHNEYIFYNEKNIPRDYYNYSIYVQILDAKLDADVLLTIFYKEAIENEKEGFKLQINLLETLINSSSHKFSLTNQSKELGIYYRSFNASHFINQLSYEYCLQYKAVPSGYYGIQLENKDIYSNFNSTITLKITIESIEDNTFYRWAINSFLDDVFTTETTTVTTTVTRKP